MGRDIMERDSKMENGIPGLELRVGDKSQQWKEIYKLSSIEY